MADYIDREALLKDVARIGEYPWREWETAEVFALVAKQPAVGVAPVRYGKWIRVGSGTACSKCMTGLKRTTALNDEWVDLSEMPYCPKCGAIMEANHS